MAQLVFNIPNGLYCGNLKDDANRCPFLRIRGFAGGDFVCSLFLDEDGDLSDEYATAVTDCTELEGSEQGALKCLQCINTRESCNKVDELKKNFEKYAVHIDANRWT